MACVMAARREKVALSRANLGNSAFGHANYEDPDINVAIPVFSIHGNHDDPSGVCSLYYLNRPDTHS